MGLLHPQGFYLLGVLFRPKTVQMPVMRLLPVPLLMRKAFPVICKKYCQAVVNGLCCNRLI